MDDHVGKPIASHDLKAKLDRWLKEKPGAPVAADRPQVLDMTIFDSIADLLGPAKTLSTLQKLAGELEARFAPDPNSPEQRERYGRDAHVVTSVAGMLGFSHLSRCCADILALPPDDVDGFAMAAQETRLSKDATSRKVVAMIGERLEAAPPA